jgi:hypothetical protein
MSIDWTASYWLGVAAFITAVAGPMTWRDWLILAVLAPVLSWMVKAFADLMHVDAAGIALRDWMRRHVR